MIENASIAIFQIVEAGDETRKGRRLYLDSTRRSFTLQQTDGPKYRRPESIFFRISTSAFALLWSVDMAKLPFARNAILYSYVNKCKFPENLNI